MASPRVRVRCRDRKIMEMLFKCLFFTRDRTYTLYGLAHITYEFHSDGYRCEPPKRSSKNWENITRAYISNHTRARPARFAGSPLDVRRRRSRQSVYRTGSGHWGRSELIIDNRRGRVLVRSLYERIRLLRRDISITTDDERNEWYTWAGA